MPVKFLGLVALAAATMLGQGAAQQRSRMDVDSYTIDAQLDPGAQTIRATTKVRFTPLDEWDPLESTCRHASLSIL